MKGKKKNRGINHSQERDAHYNLLDDDESSDDM
jgi:hypothetical protein